MVSDWSEYLSEPREEEIYGIEYWLVSNEWTNEVADQVEQNGGDPYRPTEGTAYHINLEGKPLVSIDTTQQSEEIEAVLAHEETHIYIDRPELNTITSEAIAIARENHYRKQNRLQEPNLTQRDITGSILKDIIAIDHAKQWTKAYQQKASQETDQKALQKAKQTTEHQPTKTEKIAFPIQDPYLQKFEEL